MADAAALFRLLTWFSPAFPIGAYAHSHGLEWAIAAGHVTDAASLRGWLGDVLLLGSGRADAILLRHAHRAARDRQAPERSHSDCPGAPFHPSPRPPSARGGGETPRFTAPLPTGEGRGEGATPALRTIAELAAAMAPCHERQTETLALGAAFAKAAAFWGNLESAPYPVAVGALTGRAGIAEDDAVAAYLQAFAANLVSAGVRLIPLGQSAGLAVLAGLEPAMLAVLHATRDAGLDELGGACWRSDIAAMRHETQYTRLFRT